MSANQFYDEGLESLQKGDLESAEKWFIKSIEAFPDDVYSYNKLAFVYNERNKFEKAVQLINVALEKIEKWTISILEDMMRYHQKVLQDQIFFSKAW